MKRVRTASAGVLSSSSMIDMEPHHNSYCRRTTVTQQRHAASAGGTSGQAAIHAAAPLAALRCPGGPRMTSMGIKSLFGAPSGGYLAKYDQRFILNLKLTHQIMAHLSKTNKTNDKLLIELGPGAGALTRSLLTRPCVGVLGIEIDARYNALLEQISNQTNGKFTWKNADILQIDEFDAISDLYPDFTRMHERHRTTRVSSGGKQHPSGLENARRQELLHARRKRQQGAQASSFASAPRTEEVAEAPQDMQWWSAGDAKVEVVGNLPFSMITELLMRYAVDCSQQRGLFRFGRVPLHVFVQKEIAERLTATPGTPQFSRLSVLAQNFFRVAVRQTFTEMTYFPRTEVLGCLVSLEPRLAPLVDVNASVLINFSDIVMKPGMRNTMMSKALNRCVPHEVALYILQELRLDGSVLPAQLSTIEVAKMARLWQRFLEATNQTGGGPAGSSGDGPQHTERTFDHVRTHIDKEKAALEYDWAKEERYAQRQREKKGGGKK